MKLLRFAATTATTLAIATGGVAGIVGASSVSNSGPQGHVSIHASNHQDTKNNNNTDATNSNWQSAGSGSVSVRDNTKADGSDNGSGSGAAKNDNGLNATVTNDNTGGDCGCGTSGVVGGSTDPSDGMTVKNSGPNGEVKIDLNSDTHVTNNNNTTIHNSNDQSAKSGNVEVKDNTKAGGATSGNATNSNTTTITVGNKN